MERDPSETIILRKPKRGAWPWGACAAAFLALALYVLLTPTPGGTGWVCAAYALFALMGVYGVLDTLLWRITIPPGGDAFEYRGALGRRRVIRWADVRWQRALRGSIQFCAGERRKLYLVEKSVPGAAVFAAYLDEWRVARVKSKGDKGV